MYHYIDRELCQRPEFKLRANLVFAHAMTVELAIDEQSFLFIQRQTLHLRVRVVCARPRFGRASLHGELSVLLVGHGGRARNAEGL